MLFRSTAPFNFSVRALPFLLCFGIAFGLFSALSHADSEVPHAEYAGEIPFATIADVFPDGTITEDNDFLDYGTVSTWSTAVSENYEWNESCHVTSPNGETYYCILRLSYHETTAEWIACGLERDYYTYDAKRYHGKRFEDLPAPKLDVDSVRVYRSYGTLHVLMRDENRVVQAAVTIGNQSNTNQWKLWAQAMAEKLR